MFRKYVLSGISRIAALVLTVMLAISLMVGCGSQKTASANQYSNKICQCHTVRLMERSKKEKSSSTCDNIAKCPNLGRIDRTKEASNK